MNLLQTTNGVCMKKICKECKQEKDINDFHKHNQMKDGHYNICAVCRQLKRKRKYEEDEKYRERINERNSKSYENNKEKRSETFKEKYNSNEKFRKGFLERSKEQRKESPEKVAEYKHTHYLKYSEEYKRRAKLHRYLRRAQMKETDITNQYLKEEKTKTNKCPLCNCRMTSKNNKSNQYNLDHIIPLCVGGKHLKRNVRYIYAELVITQEKQMVQIYLTTILFQKKLRKSIY